MKRVVGSMKYEEAKVKIRRGEKLSSGAARVSRVSI